MDCDYCQPNASSPCNNTVTSDYTGMKVREKKLLSSNKNLRRISRKAPHAFPNTAAATTAHLSRQPGPGSSMRGSDLSTDRKGEAPSYRRD